MFLIITVQIAVNKVIIFVIKRLPVLINLTINFNFSTSLNNVFSFLLHRSNLPYQTGTLF